MRTAVGSLRPLSTGDYSDREGDACSITSIASDTETITPSGPGTYL